ncbi:putative Transmembrane protein [Quillaja saponaria]|uniref:Transmembrane protein n=1 Tax=Quillaja saponaria TaxID=32244 RepID=A0AAD7PAI3_QUISA|nr:putative Transmembrane protein [Quillaja saponaria]
MQQRSSISTSRDSGDNEVTMVTQQPQVKPTPRRKIDEDTDELPLYDLPYSMGKRENSRPRSPTKWIHAIPLIVLLCVFILWWFSYSVNLTIKDGSITALRQIEIPLPLNKTHIDFTILAVAASPISSASQNLSSNNDIPILLNDTHINLTIPAVAASPTSSFSQNPLPLNETLIDLTSLAVAAPTSSFPQNFSSNNEIEEHWVRTVNHFLL